jgi:bacterial/archaeal transporter family-2 protein
MNLIYLFAAAAIGMAFSIQPSVSAAGSRVLGSPVAAAVVSVAITLLCLVVALPFFGGSVRPSSLLELPWWIVLGGAVGALIVAGGATIAPVTGAALFFICLIAGQLIASVVLDHVGAFGMTPHPVSALRLGGIAVVIAGVLMVRAG